MPHKDKEPRKGNFDLINLGDAFNRLLIDQDYSEVQDGAYYEFLKLCQKQVSKDSNKKLDIDEETLGILKWNLLAFSLGFETRPIPHKDKSKRKKDSDFTGMFLSTVSDDMAWEETPYWFGVHMLTKYIHEPNDIPLYMLRHYLTARPDEPYSQFTEIDLDEPCSLETVFKKEISEHDRARHLVNDFKLSLI